MLGFAMSPRRNQRKTTKSKAAQQPQPDTQKVTITTMSMNESSEDSDESIGYETPPCQARKSLGNETSLVGNEKYCKWWLTLSKKGRQERENCIKIYVLSPFLFGVVPPGLEDKVIDWSYECNLLPNKDIQQIFPATDQAFESVRVVEDAFCILADYWTSKEQIINILDLKDKFIKQSSVKAAIKCAEGNQWFKKLRSHVKLVANSKKEMGDMSFLLAIYHFAGQFSIDDDILTRYQQDCQLGEEKALVLKAKGNAEFSSENFRAAISFYTRAVGLSPFNYIVYGNRAQTYLKLEDYRKALIDAKRAVILKPDWDKGQYRFNQAVKALLESEGEKASLSFFIGRYKTPNTSTENIDKKKPRGKGKATFAEDSDCNDLPELVSASDDDTSGEYEELEKRNKTEMPDLIEYSNDDSSSDEDDSGSNYSAMRNGSRKDRKKNKKLIAMIIEDQQARKEEESKKSAKKDVVRKKISKPDKAKIKEVSPVEDLIPLSKRKTQVGEILREGSKALVHDSFEHASERYSKALGIIDTGPRKSLEFGDKSYVVVLYAYGTAMLGMNMQKKVEAAKYTFENIINSFKSVEFPLAYYGLGRVYYLQHRFQEAVTSLEEGLHIVGDRSFETFNWPGTDIVIEETKKKNMKVVLENILTRCKYPPKPDATCRFDTCNRLKKTIYNTDSDYKGYVRILCNDACIVEYHIHCWKKLKSNNIEKSSDKDFLDSECFTLDCCGHIVGIQIHDPTGLKEDYQSSKQNLKKYLKPEKIVPTTTSINSKKKKRSKRKETKPEMGQRDLNDVQLKQNTQESNIVPVLLEEINGFLDKQENKNEVNSMEEVAQFPDTGMFVLKKTDDQPIFQSTKQPKGKNKKKKKNVQSLDEFLGRDNEHFRPRSSYFDGEDYDEIPAEPFICKPPPGWMSDTFTIPAHLQYEAREIEDSLKTYSSDPWKMDSIREYVYSSFIQLLKVRGSLHIDSQPMKDNLNVLPDEARKLVQEDGGLSKFLLQSSLFTMELGVVTNVEVKLFKDLSNNHYKNKSLNKSLDIQEEKIPLVSKPEMMDSLSIINEHMSNGSKSAFADQNNENIKPDDYIKHKQQNTEKTGTKNIKNDIECNKEPELEQHQSKKVDELSGNGIINSSTHTSIINEAKKCVEEALKCNMNQDVQSEFINTLTLLSKDLLNQKNKEQNINLCYKSQGDAGSTPLEIKLTKDKGIQAKPTVKNKTAMTETMLEPYKLEYEKLLYESEAWNIKHQDAMEKTDKLQKTHCQQMLNLTKKLQDLEKHNENNNKKLENMDCRYQQEIKTFHREKHESDEKIKKLQEQLVSQSKTDEGRIEVLKTTMAALELRNQVERELLQTEIKNVVKLKSFSQQQAQRACNAEVKLLELQRDVNFSFYTRALQEADLTLHNIGQMLAMNPSSQLHEISQTWQRYITECKHQINYNKTQFETFIPQVNEGKPLATLTSLHIALPGAYPGPPILHLPAGVIPSIHKTSLRSRSPTSTNNLPGKHGAVPSVVRADGPRPPVSQPVNQTNNLENVPISVKSMEQSQKASNSFEKIMLRLSTLFPNYSRVEMTNFIKEVRASKNGSLTGLSFDDIVACVTQLVNRKDNQTTAVGSPIDQATSTNGVTSLSKPAVPNECEPLSNAASSQVIYEDDPCVICHDEMNDSTRNVSLDCSHKFHHDCIKKWLVGEQSTCPTCRVHALLPEEFPQLK